MSDPKTRQPSIFNGTPDEDATEWLSRFEEIARFTSWRQEKLEYVGLYLEGTARQWSQENTVSTWEEFKERFLETFKQHHFKLRVEANLRSRRQGPKEPVIK